MFNSNTTIIIVFNLLQMICATNMNNELENATSPDSAIENNAPGEKLESLQTTEVLPLILFPGKDLSDAPTPTLNLQETLSMLVIKEGKLVKGTKSSSGTSNEPIFFCPEHYSEEDYSKEICLRPQKFEEFESLECHQKALPVARNDPRRNSCGVNKRGLTYNIGYEICPMEGVSNNSDNELEQNRNKLVQIYTVCYDEIEDTVDRPIYTIHYIRSPKLLNSKKLEEERKVMYPYRVYDHEEPTNQKFEKWTVVNELVPTYKVQTLVPVEDMALGLWRKTTYLTFNLEWQHEKLFPFWNEINDYVRVKAIQMSDENIGVNIYTGVFYIPIDVWVKMIITVPSDIEKHPIEGIAILMNNFIDDNSSGLNSEAIATMCDDDLCIENLKKKFKGIGGRVRCCSLKNGKIGQLFDEEDTVKEYPVLKIPGINVAETVSEIDMID